MRSALAPCGRGNQSLMPWITACSGRARTAKGCCVLAVPSGMMVDTTVVGTRFVRIQMIAYVKRDCG